MMDVFLFVCENKTMTFLEMVLRRGLGRRGRTEEVNLIKIYCKHIYKCHSASSCTFICK
jgi:hypothetical protein